MKKIQFDKEIKIAKIRNSILNNLKNNRVKIIEAEVTFDKNQIILNKEKLNFDKIIIAAGSKSKTNINFSIHKKSSVSISSDDFLDIDYIPKKLAIIGAGYIGLELGCIFSSFGSKVTIFEKSDKILTDFETITANSLEFRLKKAKIDIIKNIIIREITNTNSIKYLSNNEEIISEEFNHILLSIGREPNEICGLEVERDKSGFIKVNNNFETSIKNIFAIGDIIGPPFFAHRASRQANLLSDYLINGEFNKNEGLIPEVIFTNPEIAKVGIDEDELVRLNIDYKVYKIPYGVLGKSIILNETGQLKILTDKNKKILGCVIIGKYASELIGYMCLAISKNMKIDELKDIIMPHPTFSELFLEIGLKF